MADDALRQRHLILRGFTTTRRFTSPQSFPRHVVPERNRTAHGNALKAQIQALKDSLSDRTPEDSFIEEEPDLLLEFVGFSDVELAFDRLPRERSGIELLNVRTEDEVTYATVRVPAGKLPHFEKIIEDYLTERRGAKGQSLDHRKLVDTIKEIRAGSLRALWTDDLNLFPKAEEERICWEVWLPIRRDRNAVVQTFRTLAEAQDIRVPDPQLEFRERTVLLAFGSVLQMTRSVALLNNVAELRRGKETAEFFDSLTPQEQRDWIDDLLQRIRFSKVGESVPHICLLDTGINNGHPLIAPALSSADLHTIEPVWLTSDGHGHGTAMAGVALAGDLTRVLDNNETMEVAHRLESVKLLPQDGANEGDPHLHGYLTIQAVSRPEISAPDRARLFGLAVTSRDGRDRGRPSAWSAVIDSLASDDDGDGANPRLIVVAAGNIQDPNAWLEYPNSNDTDAIHDPGQAWNAVTIGAHTELIQITEEGAENYQPIAVAGALSPYSTTSLTWADQWPLKPDIVFEGGNVARDGIGASQASSLSLLTTHYEPQKRTFTTTFATSAATAMASRMAAQLMAAYPELRPETIRALLVHSASWTNEMQRMFLPPNRSPTKSDYAKLIRRCGFGVPDLTRARWSVSNSLVMVVEEQLHPFRRQEKGKPALRDMQLHQLPWPQTELEALGDTVVEMRVTLSYFIEPNPSARGRSSAYRYESHGLRFDVKRPGESVPQFESRINVAARDEEEGSHTRGDDSQWVVGKQNRHRGSLHSDIWKGTAADLASRGVLAVYPALGWWKTRSALQRYDKAAPYSLIVSIHAPDVEVDLYTAIANEVASHVGIAI